MTSSIYSEESDLDVGLSSAMSMSAPAAPWYAHLLDFDDLATVDPERGEFLSALQVGSLMILSKMLNFSEKVQLII